MAGGNESFDDADQLGLPEGDAAQNRPAALRARQIIEKFAKGGGNSALWPNLVRSEVAAGARERIDDPNMVNQSNKGLCGVAGFIRGWLFDDPASYAMLVWDLYDTGMGHLGYGKKQGKLIKPCSMLRDAKPPDQGNGRVFPHVDWMVLASVRDSLNNVLRYYGNDGPWNMVVGSTAGDVVEEFKTAGYERVTDRTSLGGAGYDNIMAADEMFRMGYRVMLMINAAMMSDATENDSSSLPNHWVALSSTVTERMDHSLCFWIYSWGKGQNRIPEKKSWLPLASFIKNYYGFVAGKMPK